MKTVILAITLMAATCNAATFTYDPNTITTKDEIVTIPCVITISTTEYEAMEEIGKKPTDIVNIVDVISRWVKKARYLWIDSLSDEEFRAIKEQE